MRNSILTIKYKKVFTGYKISLELCSKTPITKMHKLQMSQCLFVYKYSVSSFLSLIVSNTSASDVAIAMQNVDNFL
jgi:hypothetical protein